MDTAPHFVPKFRVLLAGDSGGGKTSIVLRYCEDFFADNFIQTVGIDFKFKTVFVHEREIKLQIWDTAGQERFRGITTAYFRNADAVIVVFDLSRPGSMENASSWIDTNEDHLRFIVGNKSDESDPNEYDTRRKRAAELFSDRYGRPWDYFEVSAKTGSNVDAMFERVAYKIASVKPLEPVTSRRQIVDLRDDTSSSKETTKCCRSYQ